MVQSISTGNNIDSLLASANQAAGQKKAGPKGYVEDTVSLGEQTQSAATYSRSLITGAAGSGTDGGTDFEDLLSRLLERQGITWEAAVAGEAVEIDEETRAEARALITGDGYWGVEKTSERIFQMAVANAGGDTARADEIMAAIDKGFDMAKEVLGGTLPEISRETYTAVMEKLDSWAEETTA